MDKPIDLTNTKERKAAEEATAEKICSEFAPLFHDAERKGWANIGIDDHRETHSLDSEEMEHYLRQKFFEATKAVFGIGWALPKKLLTEKIESLKARALYEGPQHETFLRVGQNYRGTSSRFTKSRRLNVVLANGVTMWAAVTAARPATRAG